MDEFEIVGFMNTIENILKDTQQSMSIRQLKAKTGLSKRNVYRLIKISNHIEVTPSIVHGSFKKKIHCYRYHVTV